MAMSMRMTASFAPPCSGPLSPFSISNTKDGGHKYVLETRTPRADDTPRVDEAAPDLQHGGRARVHLVVRVQDKQHVERFSEHGVRRERGRREMVEHVQQAARGESKEQKMRVEDEGRTKPCMTCPLAAGRTAGLGARGRPSRPTLSPSRRDDRSACPCSRASQSRPWCTRFGPVALDWPAAKTVSNAIKNRQLQRETSA